VGTLAVVIGAAIAFHAAAYAFNDVIDLPIDRTQPRRARSPLVRGEISPRAVALAAAICAFVALLLAASDGLDALLSMTAALTLLLVYNLYGKRTRVTPLTDLVQGLGWAALAAYGATAIDHPTTKTAWIGGYITLLIVEVNGVHGPLRDLPNDYSAGARTTAILLGAEPGAPVPRRLAFYAVIVHVAMIATLVAPLAAVEAAVGSAIGALCLVLLVYGLARADDPPRAWVAGLAYIVIVLTLPVLLVLDHLNGPLAALLGVLYVVPWVSVGRPLRQRRGR
jgi:4-hydroxybenzoate polyprenyltransferase